MTSKDISPPLPKTQAELGPVETSGAAKHVGLGLDEDRADKTSLSNQEKGCGCPRVGEEYLDQGKPAELEIV
eukprot:CAMPEP_0185613944 /NCGR_PEP_ID=MMETSP0436-20130131/29424_1 /TAXON_ID=626734 ORGANISM="Favella taraikaensis, Strain Fe Narragansett Bay" /NCGR_SAMPLE_ID=MMETSP0436 /ASSEMBLY_ACC=CAM_ASM_000390 /LENGTH=71 /DNA_ID=CAMNT_0028248327 /DNA_START=533 /DNA_END=747 /DNA_ORIENTATION=-